MLASTANYVCQQHVIFGATGPIFSAGQNVCFQRSKKIKRRLDRFHLFIWKCKISLQITKVPLMWFPQFPMFPSLVLCTLYFQICLPSGFIHRWLHQSVAWCTTSWSNTMALWLNGQDALHQSLLKSQQQPDHRLICILPTVLVAARWEAVFDKAINQLLKHHSKAIENSGNTVGGGGGVHWLATHHLNVLKQALKGWYHLSLGSWA